jgi:hypothetical protein
MSLKGVTNGKVKRHPNGKHLSMAITCARADSQLCQRCDKPRWMHHNRLVHCDFVPHKPEALHGTPSKNA